ncbi:hypothetical protein DYI37_13205 [Fulvimarina endophytica]|uniref:Uncharacterized protein n=2 Tax=Fulvimarina endophytica TaxID=2293836 RepID=A0A371X1R0_9HYPH|nr:hypothetical protein DYI37_13205 [Fulvimarina endophytica]
MLVVWIMYLQLLLNGYRRLRQASILVTRGAGSGLGARCLITNMSQEPIYVTSLIVEVRSNGTWNETQLTDMRDLPEELGSDPTSAMRQGSLERGQYLDIGHFSSLLDQLASNDPEIRSARDIDAVKITVVALYGPETLPVGAKRMFTIDRNHENGSRVIPNSVRTEQIYRKRERRRLLKELEKYL